MFTDDKLNRLKELLIKPTPSDQDCRDYERLLDDIGAIINRLEAAEAALMADCDCGPKEHPDKCKELIAWNKWCESKEEGRKAAGKEGQGK